MKTRTSKLASVFTSVALAAAMLASCGGSSDKISRKKTLTATRPITQRKTPLSVSQQTLFSHRFQEIKTLSAISHSAHLTIP